MLTKRISLCVAMVATLPAARSSAAAAAALAPVGPWTLHYDETQCTAVRKYGRPNDPITLAIRPAPNGETYELLVGRNRSGPDFGQELRGTVNFGQAPISAWVLHYGQSGKKIDAYSYRIGASDMAQAHSARSVNLTTNGGPDFWLILDSMGELLSGLEKCTADLMAYWNFDGRKIAVKPKGRVFRLFKSGDYPDEALWRNQQGAVQFLLLIDERGSVAGCHVLTASGIPALDAVGCQVIRERVKMKPARDAQDRPVRSTYVTPLINWQIATSD